MLRKRTWKPLTFLLLLIIWTGCEETHITEVKPDPLPPGDCDDYAIAPQVSCAPGNTPGIIIITDASGPPECIVQSEGDLSDGIRNRCDWVIQRDGSRSGTANCSNLPAGNYTSTALLTGEGGVSASATFECTLSQGV